MEKFFKVKHPTLLRKCIIYGQKSFITLAPGQGQEPTLEWSTLEMLHMGRLRSYLQTLDKAGKAFKGQALAYYEHL